MTLNLNFVNNYVGVINKFYFVINEDWKDNSIKLCFQVYKENAEIFKKFSWCQMFAIYYGCISYQLITLLEINCRY